jgi:hypothetical protein
MELNVTPFPVFSWKPSADWSRQQKMPGTIFRARRKFRESESETSQTIAGEQNLCCDPAVLLPWESTGQRPAMVSPKKDGEFHTKLWLVFPDRTNSVLEYGRAGFRIPDLH